MSAERRDCCLAGSNDMPQFAAPEVVQGAAYGRPVDVWATGVLLYLLLSGNLPFYPTKDQLLNSSSYGAYSVCTSITSYPIDFHSAQKPTNPLLISGTYVNWFS